MYKLLSNTTLFILMTGCTYSPTITKEAAQVAFHHQMTQLIDGCGRLGPVNIEYKTQRNISNNKQQVYFNMRQQAYEKYGADNLVIISFTTIGGSFGKSDTIYAQGVAFKCNK